jgi:hypothetical protein
LGADREEPALGVFKGRVGTSKMGSLGFLFGLLYLCGFGLIVVAP